ncbi:MAG: YfiR family protein [Thermodesulfovibrionales bacterium]
MGLLIRMKGRKAWQVTRSVRRAVLRVCLVLCIAVLGVFATLISVGAQSKSTQEYQVKAAFLYSFTKFVEWPDSSFANDQASLSICILGEDPFGDALDAIRSKTVRDRKLVIKQISEIENMGQCHILFISESEKLDLPAILRKIGHMAILTVGDMKGFTESGGMINLVKLDKKIRFKINLKAAQKAGLKLSSQLLKLAVEIEGGDQR